MNRLLQFEGRATRSEYWCFAIIHNMIKAFVTMIEFAWYGIGSPPLPAYFTISGELSLGYAVLAFIPCLAITIRRFHDIGVSGAFFILLHIPFIGPLLFLGLGFIGSEQGENKYGPHPDAPSTLSQEAGKDEPKEAGKDETV